MASTKSAAFAVKGHMILVRIAGPQGSGKTILANLFKDICKEAGIFDVQFIETNVGHIDNGN